MPAITRIQKNHSPAPSRFSPCPKSESLLPTHHTPLCKALIPTRGHTDRAAGPMSNTLAFSHWSARLGSPHWTGVGIGGFPQPCCGDPETRRSLKLRVHSCHSERALDVAVVRGRLHRPHIRNHERFELILIVASTAVASEGTPRLRRNTSGRGGNFNACPVDYRRRRPLLRIQRFNHPRWSSEMARNPCQTPCGTETVVPGPIGISRPAGWCPRS